MNNTQKKLGFIGLLLAGCIATSIFTGMNTEQAAKSFVPVAQGSTTAAAKPAAAMRIYVSGAVLEPGIYELPAGSRAEAAVSAAGGFTAEADRTRVNLARRLKDGAQVNVPMLKRGNNKAVSEGKRKKAAAGEKAAPIKQPGGKRININSASAGELQKLPGIGPSLAQRIIAERERARFTTLEGLLRVKGIGKSKLEGLRELAEAD